MKMMDKSSTLDDAVARISDGASVMLGGFGVPGTPFALINALVRHGAKDLTIIKNDANEPGMGVDRLLENGQVKKLVATHIGLNPNSIRMMNDGKIAVEFCGQGIMAERIRCAGAGLKAFITDIGVDTALARGKQVMDFDGQTCLVENTLKADFALVHAARSDRFGNLVYSGSARNFNPLMAMAADYVIAEAEELLPTGDIGPDEVHTPGPFVDCVVELAELTGEYDVVRR